MIDQWALLEWDFQETLHLDLEDAWRVRSWRWFALRVQGLLLKPETRISKHFQQLQEDPDANGTH